jgi:hypothetical protein
MRDDVLVWYQQPFPEGTVYFARHLQDPGTAVEILRHASTGVAKITREGWRHLWGLFGLNGLIVIARQSECFESADDEELAGEIIRRSLIAGYDPVSGLFGAYAEKSNTFELAAP